MESIFSHLITAKQHVSTGLSAITGIASSNGLTTDPTLGPNSDLPHYNSGITPPPVLNVGPNTDIPHYNPNGGWNNPQGLTEDNSYTIVTRAFAPDSTFGFGFEGNDRGYSIDIDAESKVTQEIGIDLDEDQAITSFDEYSDETRHRAVPAEIHSPREIPQGQIIHNNVVQDGDRTVLQFGTELDAKNPFTDFLGVPAPSIDIFTEYEIIQDKENNILTIGGTITGDNFPATEALIYDANGQALFLGVGAPPALASPLVDLLGENNRPITNFELSVNTDDHGNFISVEADGQAYTIEEWNESFTSQEIDFTDPITDPFNEAFEEFNEAGEEVSGEFSEAVNEIGQADGFFDTAGETLEGTGEVAWEVLEGGTEITLGSIEGKIDTITGTTEAVIDKIFD